jgi:hypothetical protein
MVTERREHSTAMFSDHVLGLNNTKFIYYIYCNILYRNTRADPKVRFPYLLKINSSIYFQTQIHNMKA